MATGPALQLTYFDVPGRAEAIRKTLSIANLPFADTRISQETFRDQKASFPYGAVPVLDVDGQRFAEMQAILRYAGRLTGLYPLPSEPVAAALVDEVLDAFEDLFTRLLIPSMMEKDAAKKQQMRLALLAGPLPEALRQLDARLAKIATYPVFQEEPARVFVHDVLVWDFVEWMRSTTLDCIPTTLIDGFKTMVAIHDKVDAIKSPNQIARATAPAITSPGPLPKTLKLSYFDMPGRAEPIRLALHLGGIEFEDERLSYEEFLERKHTLPYGHLPVLAIDGVTLAQSTAILRYAGSLAGLYPTQGGDALAAMRIDEVLSHVSELFYALDPWFGEQDPEKRRELGVSLAAETIPRSLESLDARLAGWKGDKPAGPLVGGDQPTIADIVVFVLMQFLELEFFPATAVDDATAKPTDAYEHLVSVTDAVGALPRVAEWYAHHGEPTA